MPYSHGVAQFADLFAPPPAKDAEFLLSLVGSGRRLLDIGAGVGGTAFKLAEAGQLVTALEPDPEMFAVLLSRLAQRPDIQGRVAPVPAAAGFDLGAGFDLAFSLAVVHLLEDMERLELACYAARQVKRDGRVVLEIPVAATTRKPAARELSGRRALGELVAEKYTTMDPVAGGWWHTVWEFRIVKNDVPIYMVSRTFRWYPLPPADAFALLERAGLQVLTVFGGFDRAPFVEGESRTLLAVARAI